MRIELSMGDTLLVMLADTDGSFAIRYDKEGIRVEADLPDTDNREGVIYEERFQPFNLTHEADLKVYRDGLKEQTPPLDWAAGSFVYYTQEGLSRCFGYLPADHEERRRQPHRVLFIAPEAHFDEVLQQWVHRIILEGVQQHNQQMLSYDVTGSLEEETPKVDADLK